MKKISISNVVEFGRKKSPASQLTFINNLRKPKKEDNPEGGGHYWIHSLSVISSTFISEDNSAINDKIDVLIGKIEASKVERSKDMYQKNINILYSFEDFKFSQLKPDTEIKSLSKRGHNSIITIKGLPLQVLPNHVFSFDQAGLKSIGAIWFVAKLNGYKKNELAIFTDALYRYLNANYADKFKLSPEFCLAVDVNELKYIRYSQVLNDEVTSALIPSVNSIKAFIK